MLNFRNFLETDEIHPFQQWHQNTYKPADEFDRGKRRKAGMLSHTIPSTADKLKPPSVSVIHIADLEGSTSGHHGYGDVEEYPADDPYTVAEWAFHINGKTDKLLHGFSAFSKDRSGGSYHERWLRLAFFVIIPENLARTPPYDELEISTYMSAETIRKIGQFFKFQGLKKLVDSIEEDHPETKFPVKPGETRDDYWKRLIGDVETPPDPSGYNPRDDYWKGQ